MPPRTLMEIHRQQWVEHLFTRWAKAMTDDLIAVKFVDELEGGAVATYYPPVGLRGPRIELKKTLLRGPVDDLWLSFYHEINHHGQRKLPRHRRKDWRDEELQAEAAGKQLLAKTKAACRRHGTSLDALLRYPDDD